MRKELFSIGTLTVGTIRGGGLDQFNKKIYLDPVNGSDGNTGLSMTNAIKTLPRGYGLLKANKNEALIWLPGSSYVDLTSAFTWSKAFTHLVGLQAPDFGYGGRCRMRDTAAISDPLFTLAAIGCKIYNIHFQRDYNSNVGVVNVQVGSSATNGSYSYFEGCQLDSPIYSALGAAAYRNLYLYDGARSNTFRKCTIGAWNQLATSTSGYQLYAPGTAGYGYAGTHFDECTFMWYGNSASITPLRVNHVGDTNCYMLFDKCKFLGLGTAVDGLFYGDPTSGSVILVDPKAMGVTEYINGSASHIFVINAYTGNLAAGLAVSNFS